MISERLGAHPLNGVAAISLFVTSLIFSPASSASFEQGVKEFDAWNLGPAIQQLGDAVRAGDQRAAVLLARIYRRGFLLTPSDEVALLDGLLAGALAGVVEAKGEAGRALTAVSFVRERLTKNWPAFNKETPNAIRYLAEACEGGYTYSCKVLAQTFSPEWEKTSRTKGELPDADVAEAERWWLKTVALQQRAVEKGDLGSILILTLPPPGLSPDSIRTGAMFHALLQIVAGERSQKFPLRLPDDQWAQAIEEARAFAATHDLAPPRPAAALADRIAIRLLETQTIDEVLVKHAAVITACYLAHFAGPAVSVRRRGWDPVFRELSAGAEPILRKHLLDRSKVEKTLRNERYAQIKSELIKQFTDIQLYHLDRFLDGPVQRKRLPFERAVIIGTTEGAIALTRLRFDPALKSLEATVQDRVLPFAKANGLVFRQDESGANDRFVNLNQLLTQLRISSARSFAQLMGAAMTLTLSREYDRLSRYFSPRDFMDTAFLGGITQSRFEQFRTAQMERFESVPQIEKLRDELEQDLDRLAKSIEVK